MRNIAIALIIRDGYILVGESFDDVKNEIFYRPLGGGIETGEDREDGLHRELKEELGAELMNVSLCTTFENIFTYRGKPGHELVHLYSADLKDERLYQRDLRVLVNDTTPQDPETACWMPIQYFQDAKAPLYPERLLEYIESLAPKSL